MSESFDSSPNFSLSSLTVESGAYSPETEREREGEGERLSKALGHMRW